MIVYSNWNSKDLIDRIINNILAELKEKTPSLYEYCCNNCNLFIDVPEPFRIGTYSFIFLHWQGGQKAADPIWDKSIDIILEKRSIELEAKTLCPDRFAPTIVCDVTAKSRPIRLDFSEDYFDSNQEAKVVIPSSSPLTFVGMRAGAENAHRDRSEAFPTLVAEDNDIEDRPLRIDSLGGVECQLILPVFTKNDRYTSPYLRDIGMLFSHPFYALRFDLIPYEYIFDYPFYFDVCWKIRKKGDRYILSNTSKPHKFSHQSI